MRVLIRVTDVNVRSDHFYLRGAAILLPQSVIGGSNKSETAPEQLTVEFKPGVTIQTDVAGDKMILRNRSAVRDFFERAAVRGGDQIVVEAVSSKHLRVTKAP